MNARWSMAFVTLFALTASALAAPARADDCVGASLEMVTSDEASHRVDVRSHERRWQARVLPVHVRDGAWSPLAFVPEHAHLVVAVPAEGARFAVVRSAAGGGDADRVLVFEARAAGGEGAGDAALALVASWDLAELLTPDELAKVPRSVSHLTWLDRRHDGPPAVRLAGGARVALRVIGGREVVLDLSAEKAPATPRAPATPSRPE